LCAVTPRFVYIVNVDLLFQIIKQVNLLIKVLEQMRRERDILKKATAIFAKEPVDIMLMTTQQYNGF